MLARYSDGELARLIKHGVKRDGTTVRFMPAGDYQWWPMEDVTALVTYLRSVPPIDGQPGKVAIGTLGKILDRMEKFPIDIARRIDHARTWPAPVVAVTVEYGAQIAQLCTGCHGPGLSGGLLPTAPPDLPIPLNLTAHETGLKRLVVRRLRQSDEDRHSKERAEDRADDANRDHQELRRDRAQGALGAPAFGAAQGVRRPLSRTRDKHPPARIASGPLPT